MKKSRTEIGMVFQGSALFDSMTQSKRRVPLKMFTNDNKAVIKERVDFVLERVYYMGIIIFFSNFWWNAKQ
jgi:phospholipid/cholesterol/gamma-HCH transport system ATP-binding protein